MAELTITKTKLYDLEERTLLFAKRTRVFVKSLPKTTGNLEDGPQLVRASGSVGANYIEANELMNIFGSIIRKSE